MSSYWERRTAQFMWNCMEEAEGSYQDIAKLYLKASRYLQERMRGIFENYIKQTGLSETEARKLMSRLGTSDLRKLIKSLPKEVQAQIGTDTAAYGARIHRYEELQRQVDSVMKEVYKQEKKISTKCYTKLAKDSYSFGVESVFEQAGQSVSFAHVDPDKVNQVLNSEWSGTNYSKRIWGNTQQVADTVKEEMAVCMLTGKSEKAMADRMVEKFAVGSNQARRLIRTESCYVTNQMVNKGYEDCGVEEYEFSAYLDSRTSDICRELNGKRFKLSEAKVGVNMPPMHPWCRSTTLAVIDEELLKDPEDLELDVEEELETLQEPDIGEAETGKEQTEQLKGNQEIAESAKIDQRSENYRDVLDEWYQKATPNSNDVEELTEYTVKGTTYKVDGVNVRQNNSKREMEVAELIKKTFGGEIKLVPEINGKYLHVHTPDYEYRGQRWDLKELEKGASSNLLRDIVHKKKDQAECFIFDISKSVLSYDEISRQVECLFTTYFNTKHVECVMIIKGDQILRVIERQ